METQKLSFGNIKDELSRDELRNIMAGSGGGGCDTCTCYTASCTYVELAQCSNGWYLTYECGNGQQTDFGTGTYGGTVCNGACP